METLTDSLNIETTEQHSWERERTDDELRTRVLSRLALLDSVEL